MEAAEVGKVGVGAAVAAAGTGSLLESCAVATCWESPAEGAEDSKGLDEEEAEEGGACRQAGEAVLGRSPGSGVSHTGEAKEEEEGRTEGRSPLDTGWCVVCKSMPLNGTEAVVVVAAAVVVVVVGDKNRGRLGVVGGCGAS